MLTEGVSRPSLGVLSESVVLETLALTQKLSVLDDLRAQVSQATIAHNREGTSGNALVFGTTGALEYSI